jgi:hypothetical protein
MLHLAHFVRNERDNLANLVQRRRSAGVITFATNDAGIRGWNAVGAQYRSVIAEVSSVACQTACHLPKTRTARSPRCCARRLDNQPPAQAWLAPLVCRAALYDFGEVRVATLALLIFTALSR